MPDALSARRLSRRGLLAAGGAATLATLLAGCGKDDAAKPAASTGSGPWSFTDDRNQKVEAAARPTRVVAFTGVAAALIDFGLDKQLVGVFGETKRADGTAEPQAGDLNIEAVEILGNVWGEFSLEKYAALRPELLVTHMYDPDALWYVPDESKAKILPLAPSVAITTARVPMTKPIERYAALAESLGADLSAKKVTDAKARFEAGAEAVRQAVKANPGIKVMACSGSPDLFYVSNPKVSTDLMYFAELGVDIVVPTKLEAGDYFEALSWENAGKFPADLILLDNRSTALQAKDLTAKPTWQQLPGVRANQVTPWDTVPRFSYAGSAPLLENLATAIRNAKKVS
ncbi:MULTISPECIES: ABC transporter substrate-binding protein [unclassified Micromonospora]|uniref:ABC transporter substrate-binding protein n=1 Tax=unclassified Micromonospora TaxID=2617518 RepID=UPI000EF52523|nr:MULTISPECIES: ABC transporter substrate-binding protein [unclassified Micromonospora]RLP88313.1 ABC transporter substrate-binding protein [Micromonospora sp. BL4]RLP98477.1 ABC transporter substrate-binding protein [Micromonospora sp. CV4]